MTRKWSWTAFVRNLVITIIATLFVSGLVKLGLWEWLGSLWALCASGLGTVWSGYLDRLYAPVGWGSVALITGRQPNTLAMTIVVFMNVLGLVCIWLLRRLESLDAKPGEDVTVRIPDILSFSRWMRSRVLVILFSCFFLFGLVDAVATQFEVAYQATSVAWIDRSLTILHPFVGDLKFQSLEAQFRLIHDAESFYFAFNKIQAAAKEAKIQLPPFSPIRSRDSRQTGD